MKKLLSLLAFLLLPSGVFAATTILDVGYIISPDCSTLNPVAYQTFCGASASGVTFTRGHIYSYNGTTWDDITGTGVSLDAGDLTGTLPSSVLPKADVLDLPFHCADAGSTDAYACDLSPAVTGYVTGTHYFFKANTANTGAATINFNSVGAKTIVKVGGGITTTLANNDIRAGQWVEIIYDGTNMQMVSQLGNTTALTVPGSDTQCIFNDSSALGADAGCVYNKTTDALDVAGVVTGAGGLVGGTIGTNDVTFDSSGVTGHKTITIPNASGTLTYAIIPQSGAHVTHDANQSIAHDTDTYLAFNTERFDNGAFHDTSSDNSRLTAPATGRYIIVGQIIWATNGTGRRYIALVVNRTTAYVEKADDTPDATAATVQDVTTIIELTAGDYVEVLVNQQSGGALNINAVTATGPNFMIQRLN